MMTPKKRFEDVSTFIIYHSHQINKQTEQTENFVQSYERQIEAERTLRCETRKVRKILSTSMLCFHSV